VRFVEVGWVDPDGGGDKVLLLDSSSRVGFLSTGPS